MVLVSSKVLDLPISKHLGRAPLVLVLGIKEDLVHL